MPTFPEMSQSLHLRSLALHTFVDAFQGCYKNRTNGTRDCRYFAALQLVLRLLFPLAFYLTEEEIIAAFLAFVALALYILLFVITQPYKDAVYNKTDTPLLMALLFVPVTMYYIVLEPNGYSIFGALFFVPLLYLIIWSFVYIKRIITRCGWCRKETPETAQLLAP